MDNTYTPFINYQETNFNSYFTQNGNSGTEIPSFSLDQNQLVSVFMLQPLFHQLFHRIGSIETTLNKLTQEIEENKKNIHNSQGISTTPSYNEEHSHNSGRTFPMSR